MLGSSTALACFVGASLPHNVLACSRETVDRLLRFRISDDLPVYLSSSSADTSTRRVGQVLLEDLLEQNKALTILVKLCLELS